MAYVRCLYSTYDFGLANEYACDATNLLIGRVENNYYLTLEGRYDHFNCQWCQSTVETFIDATARLAIACLADINATVPVTKYGTDGGYASTAVALIGLYPAVAYANVHAYGSIW